MAGRKKKSKKQVAPPAKRPARGKARAKAKAKAKAKAEAKPKKAAKPKLTPKATKAAMPKKAAKPKAKAKAKPTKAATVKTGRTPARDARQALDLKKKISAALAPSGDGSSIVDAYLRDVDHPFKAEMEAVRRIILEASPKIAERIKWNAPSFYYKEDLGAFHPRATEYAHLILLFPGGAGMQDDSGLLEGNHKDRREAKFHSMDDVKAKKRALEKLVKNWVALRDG